MFKTKNGRGKEQDIVDNLFCLGIFERISDFVFELRTQYQNLTISVHTVKKFNVIRQNA